MPSTMLESRVTALEKDVPLVHQAIQELTVGVDVLESKVERGFNSLEKRFDSLEAWLRERL